jgi:uncharacterized protein YdaU (DUF1376 family)
MPNKPVYFSFYPSDFKASSTVCSMTPEQIGGYILLLCHAFDSDDCGLPDDDQQLALLSRLNDRWPQVGTRVKMAFKKRGSRLYNDRLLIEWNNCMSRIDKASEAGKNSAKVRREQRLTEANARSIQVQRSLRRSTNLASTTQYPIPNIDNSIKEPPNPLEGGTQETIPAISTEPKKPKHPRKAPPSAETLARWARFTTAYPKQNKSGLAKKLWIKMDYNEETTCAILVNVSEYEKTEDWLKDDGHWIPNQFNYLNDETWKGKRPKPKQQGTYARDNEQPLEADGDVPF